VDNHVFRVHKLELRWRPLDFGPDRQKFIKNVLLRAEHAKGIWFEDYSHANAALFRVLEASNDVIAREEVHDQVDSAASVIDFVENRVGTSTGLDVDRSDLGWNILCGQTLGC